MEEKLFIIDQHAAHEKVLYEKMMADLRGKQITSQYLAVPIIISLNLQQLALMRKHEGLFREMGSNWRRLAAKSIPYVQCPITSSNRTTTADEPIDSMEEEIYRFREIRGKNPPARSSRLGNQKTVVS